MKILVAEDDTDARALMVDIVGSTGSFEVVAAANGTQAWEALQANPDMALAIIDLDMPEGNGLEWLTRVRADERFARLPVIVCTGEVDRNKVAQVVAKGISSYLVKPYTRWTVLDKVHKIVHGSPAAAAGAPAVADTSPIRERLGVDREAYRLLLENHARIVDIWVVDARRASRFAEVRALSIRVATIRESSVVLGLTTLAETLQAVEAELAEYRTAPASVAALQKCLKETAGCGDRASAELVRLRATIETLS